jgi:hypothetical protein
VGCKETDAMSMAHRTLLGLGLTLLLGGCPPDPRAQDLGAAGEGGGPAVKYQVIQRDIFDRRCVTDCHEGTVAGEGLALTKEQSFGALVYQHSRQVPSLYRVLPGDAASSYLMKKLEGLAGYVGERMPKAAPRLPQSELDQLRAWITRGAPND